MTFAAVGTNEGASNTFMSITNVAVGDLMMVGVDNFSNNTVFCTGLTSGGTGSATWTIAGVHFAGTSNTRSMTVFMGHVTATGSMTITPTWSGTAPSYGIQGAEFSSTVGSWAFDKQGNLDSSGTANWPSLTPGFGAGELYWGYCDDSGTASAGSTTGYTYKSNLDGNGSGMAYNPACGAGATFPVWGDSGSQFGIAVLIYETGGAVITGGRKTVVPQAIRRASLW